MNKKSIIQKSVKKQSSTKLSEKKNRKVELGSGAVNKEGMEIKET